jgi:CNT family concentrative nucleoside transporter
VVVLGSTVYFLRDQLGSRGQAICGFFCFLGLAAAVSVNLRAVSVKTLFWGILLQFTLALLVIHVDAVRTGFDYVGRGIQVLAACGDAGSDFVFGKLAKADGPAGFVFAFKVLPLIVFISAFFTLLYYFGVLQFLVRLMARVMMYLMGTSGAETLSAAANVFMGQTEAPLIVKPFVPRMTRSELLAMMVGGMATISGSLMVVYIEMGKAIDLSAVGILCTSVMACPCGLYLSKLVLPETERPETLGTAPIVVEQGHVNAIDAISAGVKDGLFLALNVAAMLVAFIAFIALVDVLLSSIKPALLWLWLPPEWFRGWPDQLRLQDIFGWLFSPVALLMGVEAGEASKVGSLLGIKLAANEAVAFTEFTTQVEFATLSARSKMLAVFALTGFANFASVGIQLGGIGAMAPDRRRDLAKLGMTALFVGYLTTLVNACVAGILL